MTGFMTQITNTLIQNNARPLALILVLTGLYTAQSMVAGILNSALPVILRDAGMALGQIGFMSIFVLPWALKIFWAPLVDRYGTERGWILTCQLVLIACFLIAARIDVGAAPIWVLPVFAVLVLASATQDIATDAAGIHATETGSRTLASGASTMGGYAGYLIGGGLWLWVYAVYGWQSAMLTLAAIMVLLTLPALLSGQNLHAQSSNPAASLRSAISKPLLRRGLLMLLGWNGAVRLTLTVSGTMLVDAGLDLETIAWVRGAGAMGVGLITAVVASIMARNIELVLLLKLAACLFLLGAISHALWSVVPFGGPAGLIVLHLGLSAAIAISFVAIYALMIECCDPDQAATEFAVLQAFDILLLVAGAILSGLIAQYFGYATVFVIAGG